MITRYSSSSLICALAFGLVVAPAFIARAQTAPDASSPTAAPAATPAPPVATPADTNASSATAPAERPATYTIVSGDSLWAIGQKFDVSVAKLVKANNFKDKHVLLHPGQVIKIPPARSETKKTDTTAK
jgi:LysM repeat protein